MDQPLRIDHFSDVNIFVAEIETTFEDGFQVGQVKGPAFSAADKIVGAGIVVDGNVLLSQLDDINAAFVCDPHRDNHRIVKRELETVDPVRRNNFAAQVRFTKQDLAVKIASSVCKLPVKHFQNR